MKNNQYCYFIKPVIDILLSLILIALLSVLLLILSLIILIIDGQPILFRQKRMGQYKKPFLIYKFRTMRNSHGPLLTFDNDPRVTKLGRILRKFKLDELPQLFNILKGEMSFIGPRPEVSILASERYKITNKVFGLKPGITGLSSINFFDEHKLLPKSGKDVYNIYLNKILPQKIEMDSEYAKRISFSLDLTIAFKTAVVLWRSILFE